MTMVPEDHEAQAVTGVVVVEGDTEEGGNSVRICLLDCQGVGALYEKWRKLRTSRLKEHGGQYPF